MTLVLEINKSIKVAIVQVLSVFEHEDHNHVNNNDQHMACVMARRRD